MKISCGIGRVSLNWHPRDAYAGIPLRTWLIASACDSYSWFWRVCGLEINITRSHEE